MEYVSFLSFIVIIGMNEGKIDVKWIYFICSKGYMVFNSINFIWYCEFYIVDKVNFEINKKMLIVQLKSILTVWQISSCVYRNINS
jgi:hypothetical protein